jgi:hypothetical protein
MYALRLLASVVMVIGAFWLIDHHHPLLAVIASGLGCRIIS